MKKIILSLIVLLIFGITPAFAAESSYAAYLTTRAKSFNFYGRQGLNIEARKNRVKIAVMDLGQYTRAEASKYSRILFAMYADELEALRPEIEALQKDHRVVVWVVAKGSPPSVSGIDAVTSASYTNSAISTLKERIIPQLFGK